MFYLNLYKTSTCATGIHLHLCALEIHANLTALLSSYSQIKTHIAKLNPILPDYVVNDDTLLKLMLC